MSDVDVDLLIRGRSTRRRWLLLVLLAAVTVAAVAAFVLLQPDESEVVVEPQRAEVVTGQLSTTVQLTGSAAAERSTTLAFEVAGVVAAGEVEMGQAVVAGDALATLDDAEAQRRVQTAEVQFEQARLRLDDLLADPAASDIAAARQSVESAESQILSAEAALARLREPASAADVASAEQAVANARGQVSSAEEALARLREPPGAADVASAEQAVASAPAQVSSAEALAALLAGPGKEEIASAESSVTEAHAQLSSALSRKDASWDALIASFDEYCGRYDHLNDVTETTCSADPPFSDDEVAALRASIEGLFGQSMSTASPSLASTESIDGMAAVPSWSGGYNNRSLRIAPVVCAHIALLAERPMGWWDGVFLAEIQRQSRAAAADAARQERAAVKEHQAASRRAEQARNADERQRAQAARALEADRKQAEKAAAEAHLAAMLAEVDDLNRGLAETYDEIDSLLTATLSVDDHVDLESLRREVEHPAFDRADLEQPIPMPVMIPEPAEPVLEIPPPPGGFFRRKQRHAALLAAAESAYADAYAEWERQKESLETQRQTAATEHQRAESERVQMLSQERARYQSECDQREAEVAEHNLAVDTLIANLGYGTVEAVQEYVSICPRQFCVPAAVHGRALV